MTQLADYASNTYSQAGEDGIVGFLLGRMGEGDRCCVEIGAGDGRTCSNTMALREQGWRAVLVEADPTRAQRCAEFASDQVSVYHRAVSPGGDDSIDAILADAAVSQVDFMSIDVDGIDYWLFSEMTGRPRVVCVEFNKTIPPHMLVQPGRLDNQCGVSAATMRRAGEQRGFAMVGVADTNMWFVRTEDAHLLADMETDLSVLMPPESFMYLATDYRGHMVPLGSTPPWGLRWPPSPTEFVPNQPGLLSVDIADSMERWMQWILEQLVDLRRQIAERP